MTRPRRARTVTVTRWCAVAALALAGALAGVAAAQPAQEPSAGAPHTAASRDGVSLIASSTSVPVDGTFGYSASVVLTAPADFIQARLQVRRPTGRLLFQRTSSANDVAAGVWTASFARDLADLDLRPGAYPVSLEVRIDQDRVRETTVESALYVYSENASPTPVALTVRITGQPAADPSGRFISDPGDMRRAPNDAATLARWVLREPRARLSLAVPPLLLEEWRRISEGYELVEPEGVTEVAAEESVPRAYAAVLDDISQAVATGRLELLSVPYADPDPAALERAGLLDDVFTQFNVGLSATFAAMEATPTGGVSVAGGCISPAMASLLASTGASFALADPACVRTGDATPTSGVWRIKEWPGGVVLVIDPEARAALASASPDAALGRVFRRHTSSRLTSEPLIAEVELGPETEAGAEGVVSVASVLLGSPWASLTTAGEAAATARDRTLRTQLGADGDGAPADWWSDVASARSWADAFIAATGPNDQDASAAVRDSLVAESAAWSAPAGTWVLADRGRTYADSAERAATGVLGKIGISVQDVTLSSAAGKVPVTVTNGSEKQLEVTVRGRPTGGLHVREGGTRTLKLLPGDNFFEIPVDLQSSISGQLRIEVVSGGRVLSTQPVAVRASYLERLGMIAAIVLILLGMLAYIIRRVRGADDSNRRRPVTSGTVLAHGDSTEAPDERYTVTEAGPEEERT